MVRLQDIRPQMQIAGIRRDEPVEIRAARFVADALLVTYGTSGGVLAEEYLYPWDQERLTVVSGGQGWDFTGNGEELRFALEANRIRLAHLFDPYLALSTSSVEPLPHQIAAVYQEMLPRLPLRYVLADDPGAGKTIMTGLFMKELALRGSLERCLIVCPGNLAEQWQDELSQKFGMHFAVLASDASARYRAENPFERDNLLIARLDMLARNQQLRDLLAETQWDLVVCDEAHKMSATISGRDVKRTQRYRLGELLAGLTENLLLLTATPHNGKEADFQLFMSLIDKERFDVVPGRELPSVDVSDVMRRLVKEDLLRFDGSALFPKRVAVTVRYALSPAEQELYDHVTQYVREEFNRADRLENERRNTVGFALMVLQRRLASSPEAIYQSLRRRRSRLQERRLELDNRKGQTDFVDIRTDDLREGVLSSQEEEEQEERLVDGATAARTAEELDAEICVLRALEAEADRVRRSGADEKWRELATLLEEEELLRDADGERDKLIIFTEHKDTIWYLRDRIGTLLGRPESVVVIHGGLSREERRHVEEEFRNNPDVQILLATDAAGEGVNLQCAHLVVNYDLPWNPNRIEQRFGRVHRIGQTRTCHLWNMVSAQTREGRVYEVLLEKLRQQQATLPGKVYDVLGDIRFGENTLRELLIEAVRMGSREDVEETIVPKVELAMRAENLRELVRERALSGDAMDLSMVLQIREDMERMEARKLQPHFIEAFTTGALRQLGGRVAQREEGRYEISRLPAVVVAQGGGTLAAKYERICFEPSDVRLPNGRRAELITPDHPLLQAIIGAVSVAYAGTLEHGAILIDDTDMGIEPRLLFDVRTAICDGSGGVCSEQVHFVELTDAGGARDAGPAPYLDYRAPTAEEQSSLQEHLIHAGWDRSDKTAEAQRYAVQHVLPKHITAVKEQVDTRTERVRDAVRERLSMELMYLRGQRRRVRLDTKTGPARAEAINLRIRDIEDRMQRRFDELDRQRELHAQQPQIAAGAVILPRGLVDLVMNREEESTPTAESRRAIELAAMRAVEEIERSLGNTPKDVSADNVGYDIESAVPAELRSENGNVLRFIEVKGRVAGADQVMVTKNEILTALNSPDQYILAVVEVDGNRTKTTYIQQPFHNPPDFGATAVGYSIGGLKKSGKIILEQEGEVCSA